MRSYFGATAIRHAIQDSTGDTRINAYLTEYGADADMYLMYRDSASRSRELLLPNARRSGDDSASKCGACVSRSAYTSCTVRRELGILNELYMALSCIIRTVCIEAPAQRWPRTSRILYSYRPQRVYSNLQKYQSQGLLGFNQRNL